MSSSVAIDTVLAGIPDTGPKLKANIAAQLDDAKKQLEFLKLMERQAANRSIGPQNMVQPAAGHLRRSFDLLQPHIHNLRPDRLEGGAKGPGATAHLQHGAGGNRNALQQIGINPVVIVGNGGHRRRGLSDPD
jgi:hypothetical protein